MLNWYLQSGYPPAGTVIWIRAYLLFRHKGIVSDRWRHGKPTVYVNVPGRGVVEQTWDEFAARQVPQCLRGFESRLPVSEVMRRARLLLGHGYDLFTYNCDHFVNEAHGRPVVSEQLEAMKAVGLLVGLIAMIGTR